MTTGDSAEQFSPYGTSHQLAIILLVVVAVALVWVGRAYRTSDRADRLGRPLAVAMLASTLPLQILYFTPGYWDLERTLPLQLCDLASLVAAYALWTHRWWAVGLTYFWGLTLTTQAIITPDLVSDFPDPVFLLFWAMHLLVVWAAIYLTWGLGLTPDWRTYRTSMMATTVWAATVFAFNVVADTNYGYLNAKPGAASILDLFGAWPWYVLAEIMIIAAVWALATWPWVALAAKRESDAVALAAANCDGDAPPARSCESGRVTESAQRIDE